jgi:desulfoferrodoxin (superoxide reductase-like protein)
MINKNLRLITKRKGDKEMNNKKTWLILIFLFGVFFVHGGIALANKSSTSIEVPEGASKGSEIIIRVTVTHSANNFLHYTEWLRVRVGEKEIARWDFTRSQRPEGAVFTKEIKVTVDGNVEIEAEASCNIHGSKGPTTVKVTVKE